MDFEERIERLRERHEALTETVEIIARMQLKSEERQRKNDEQIAALTAAQQKTDERMALLTERVVQVMDSINSLGRIAEAHEHRLDRLEGQE